MSVIADAIADDFLGPLHLKPWWESVKEYAYKASIAVIVLFSVFDKTKFNCLPIGSDSRDFNEAQSAVVDARCGSMWIPWYISRGNLIALAMTVVTYVLSNYWLYQSGIKDKLTDLSTFGRSILEMNMSAEEMQNAAVLTVTYTSSERRQRLRKNVQILLKYRSHAAVSTFYTRRCFVVMVWSGICSAAVLWASIAEMRHPSTVPCEITDGLLQLGLGNTSNSFACLDTATIPTAMLEMVYAYTLLFQFFAMFVALCRQKTAIARDISDTMRINRRNVTTSSNVSDARTFLIHMMGIDRRQAAKIRSFTEFVMFSDAFPCKLQEYADEAIIAGDVEYFRILKKRISPKEFWQAVERTAGIVLCDGDRKAEMTQCKWAYEDPDDADYQVHLFLDKVFRISFDSKECQYHSADDESTQTDGRIINYVQLDNLNHQNERGGTKTISEKKHFGRRLMEASKWHLLFCCPLTFDQPELLKNIKSDLLDDEGRSCLYYVLRRSSMDKLLSRFLLFDQLITVISEKNIKLVHFDGKSMTPEDFFYENYQGTFRGKFPDFRLCKSPGKDPTSNECDAELKQILEQYDDNNHKVISLKLSKIKLTQLDVPEACKIAEKAAHKKHWEVLVALINTYIVVQEQGNRPRVHGLIGNDIFGLRKSQYLKQICQESLKRQRCKVYFTPTAGEHILSIMDRDIRRDMISCIRRCQLPKDAKVRLEEIARQD